MGKFNMAQELAAKKRFFSLYVLARYMYRVGEPILSDAVYENLQGQLMKIGGSPIEEYFNRPYDDDPVPVELLSEFGIKPVYFVKEESRRDLYSYLNEDKSYSIRTAVSYEEAYDFFMMLKANRLDFVASLKIDGVNTKMLYVDSRFALSLSRGRNGDSFDYTDNSAKVMPEFIEGVPPVLKIVGESFVVSEGLPVLRERYGKPDGYVSSKSAAISMLRVAHERQDYRYLRTKVFYAEGVDGTLAGTFKKLGKAGVDTVPYMLFSWEAVPNDFGEFSQWLKDEVFDYMKTAGDGVPSDGVVIEVNDLSWLGTEHGQYVDRQLALKFGHWGYAYYEGVITNIRIEQRRVYQSVRIEIEPVRTRDGNSAAVINSFNPSIVINNDLFVGKKVYFERNSEAVNILIYGDRLKEIQGEMDG